jgi:hypothetical protein
MRHADHAGRAPPNDPTDLSPTTSGRARKPGASSATGGPDRTVNRRPPGTIERDDGVDGTLPQPSVVKPAKRFTIHSTLVRKTICALRSDVSSGDLRDAARQLDTYASPV